MSHQDILEALWVVVNSYSIVQMSFLHKCGQLVWCSAFNVVVTAFFLDISSFVVNLALLPSLKLSPGGSTPQEPSLIRHYLPLSSAPWLEPNKPFDHPQASISPRVLLIAQCTCLVYLSLHTHTHIYIYILWYLKSHTITFII